MCPTSRRSVDSSLLQCSSPIHARVVPTHPGAPGGLDGPHALQILTTEHWSLLAARSLGYTEAMSRASMFIAALSGCGDRTRARRPGDRLRRPASSRSRSCSCPVVYFLGVSTFARLGQINYEDAVWIQGMNRIRHAYLELAPELEPYFVTSPYDDEEGMLLSSLLRLDARCRPAATVLLHPRRRRRDRLGRSRARSPASPRWGSTSAPAGRSRSAVSGFADLARRSSRSGRGARSRDHIAQLVVRFPAPS